MATSNRKRRIAFVSDAIYPFNKGGKERRLWEITRRLQASGVEVHIYTMKWWTGREKTLDLEGVKFHAISRYWPLYHNERRSIVQALLFGAATLKLVAAQFDVLDVDHMPYFPVFACRIACAVRRKRMVVTWHEVWGGAYWRSYLGQMGLISSIIERLAARVSPQIIAVSSQTSARLRDELGVTTRIDTIELGVDLRAIETEGESELRSDIIFAGRLLSHKHVDVLLQAVALLTVKYPTLCCRIVGEGPERSQLESLSIELNITKNVAFHDFFTGSSIYGVMKSATVFAFPSVREGFGVVVLEANGCGLPVVTIDHPDNAARHLITEGRNGFLVELDAASLAKGLDTAIEQAEFMDPWASAQSCGHLRDWSEVASSVLETATGELLPNTEVVLDS